MQNLTKYFSTPAGQLHAVDGVSFSIEEGKTLGIVGESGCGKSTTGRTILKLIEPTAGKIMFNGQDITKYSRKRMRPLRQEMQMVFQDPFSSLDPRQTVSQLIRGEITSPVNLPDECRFGKRCDYTADACRKCNPPLREIAPGHFVACARCGEV